MNIVNTSCVVLCVHENQNPHLFVHASLGTIF